MFSENGISIASLTNFSIKKKSACQLACASEQRANNCGKNTKNHNVHTYVRTS